ncbi:hypothetical protein SAMN05216555_101231 [Arthrobacter cupressi]|uniref:DUF6318 domain-containing protein n=1 Tax=Arthrobacter cupressi TaxID=1045773 RepID=A0A1G8IG00_9MICC|nr:hypothetical protein SAMN05216555_101231 [Arthrobacter cupressi]
MPELPEAATKETKEGLRAFADYWLSLMNYGFITGDYGPVNKLTVPGCKTCKNVQEGIPETYKKNGWFVGGELKIEKYSDKFQADINGTYSPLMTVSQGAMREYDSTGKQVSQNEGHAAGDDVFVMYSRFKNGSWIVADFGVPSGS